MKTQVYILLFISSLICNGQEINFSGNPDRIMVFAGQKVNIKIDTAYILSSGKATYINQKLDELRDVKRLYNSAALDNSL